MLHILYHGQRMFPLRFMWPDSLSRKLAGACNAAMRTIARPLGSIVRQNILILFLSY
jgi:hypothetical protein